MKASKNSYVAKLGIVIGLLFVASAIHAVTVQAATTPHVHSW